MKSYIKGNLAKAPQSAQTKNGIQFAKFTVVTNTFKKEADGSYTETGKNFQFVMAYGEVAETAMTLVKGQQVEILGYLQELKNQEGNPFTILKATNITAGYKPGERPAKAEEAPKTEEVAEESPKAEAQPKVKRQRKTSKTA